MTERMTAEQFNTTAAKKRRVDREGPIHMQILRWLEHEFPDAVIHHSPNELNISGNRASKAIAQNKAKEMGMRPGFPDLLILWCGHVWAIEVKAPGGRLQDNQTAMGLAIEANGFKWGVAYSLADAQALVREWRKSVVVEAPFRGQIS